MQEPPENSPADHSSFVISPEETYRLFLAIALPSQVIDDIAEISSRLQKGFEFTACRPSWSAPRSMHLTIRFLGGTAGARIGPLISSLEPVIDRLDSFSITVGGLGVFPGWRRPKVLWVGVEEPTGALARLHAEIDSAVQREGFDADRPEYHPHLTLARFRSQRGLQGARDVVASHRQFRAGKFRPDGIVLYNSRLHAGGARHDIVKTFPLRGGNRP